MTLGMLWSFFGAVPQSVLYDNDRCLVAKIMPDGKGVLARDHVHMFLSVPPHLAISTVMQRIKGRSSRRIQMEFPELRKRYWGRRFWARGYFSTTSGNVSDDVILQYLELHSKRDATGISR